MKTTETFVLLDDDNQVVAVIQIDRTDKSDFETFVKSNARIIKALVAIALRKDPYGLELLDDEMEIQLSRKDYSVKVCCGNQGDFSLIVCDLYHHV